MTGSAEIKFRIIVSLLRPTFDNHYYFSLRIKTVLLKKKDCKGDIRVGNTSLGLLALRLRLPNK
jgi:hypothetical protein